MIRVISYIQYSVRKSFLERLYGFIKIKKWILTWFFFKNYQKHTKKLWTYFILQLIGTSFKPCLWKLYNPNDINDPRKKKKSSINKKDFPVPVSGFSHRKKRAPLFFARFSDHITIVVGKKVSSSFPFFAADFSISMQIFVQCHVLPKRSQL